ncbi:unnamed protein product [Owenia fusiformis]|uniref:Uncharacterized protein n=1 Tax=Owenia fusiformis TaxID=6347 RepID=A0A8J1TAK9_OWEFU|nr:unnamed protein product [Owenia fusiformis]
MTDYEEEQANEIEALECIYAGELTIISDDPHCFTLHISSVDEEDSASCTAKFTYTPTYPEEAPLMEVSDYENLEDDQIDSLLDLMKEQAAENLGMVMVFTIVSAVQEKIHDLVEETKSKKFDEKLAAIRKQEEEEKKKFEGTRVTVETFMAWKQKFDAEMAEIKKQQGKKEKKVKGFTGYELFMTDHSLDDSDMKFFEEEEEEAVKVDESLFDNMDDLDLDAELDDLDT